MQKYRWIVEGEMPRKARAEALASQLQIILDTFSSGNVHVVSCEEFGPSSTDEAVWADQEEDATPFKLHLVPKVGEDEEDLRG